MKTSTEIQSIVDVIGEEKAIEMIAKAGFDAWDFSMFNMKKRMNPFEGLFKAIPHRKVGAILPEVI